MVVVLMLAAMILQMVQAGAVELRILEGTDRDATVGSNVTFTCFLTSYNASEKPLVKWFFNDKKVLAKCNLTDLFIDNRIYKSCVLTVSPVMESSEGLYKCEVYTVYQLDATTIASRLNVIRGNDAALHVLDPATGAVLDEPEYGRVCVQSDTTRRFECRIQDARPGTWNFTWLLGNQTVSTHQSESWTATGLVVNVSSWYIVNNLGHETRDGNLTCLATSSDQSLSVTVLITVCAGTSGLLIAMVTMVSILVVVAIVVFVKFRRNSKKQRIKGGVRSSVEMDVASDQDALGQALVGQSEVSRSPDVKDRITSHDPHKYEGTIVQHIDVEYVHHAYEVNIAPQAQHSYEYNISQQIAHQYETKLSPHDDEYDDTEPPQDETPVISDNDNLPPWAETWMVPRCDLIVDERVLGSGNFGEVRSGALMKDGELTRAAVKMLKGHSSTRERNDFMDELHTMTIIGHHPNVVLLLGACQHSDMLYVALEYLPRGDLRSYLRTARSQSDSDKDALSSDQLVKFALGVAKGMEHLAKVGVIHRDLAARNILLAEELVAKVSDFGLSRGEDIYVQTSRRRVPVRWLAIESVRYQKYTTKSDVWSFGILLWEIASIGGTPYPTIKTKLLAGKLKAGYRMTKPSNCDDKSYALMRKCWEEDPNNRPSFLELVSVLSDMDDSNIQHTYFLLHRLHYENLSAIRPEFDDN